MAAAEAAAEPAEEAERGPGSWPDFAVVCSFLERYGALLELPELRFPQLERLLREPGPVPTLLVELHLKLMRKIGKSVTVERWEKYLTRLCQDFNTTWAWEMEKKGYQEMTVECKLGMLKHLCECQFDDNLKFKNYVNEEDADAMRLQPIGRDKDGLMYWYHLDQDHNIRMYIEEQDDQDGSSWKCIVRTRNELAETLELLKAQIDPALLKKPDQQDGSSNDSPVPNDEEIKPEEGKLPSKDEELPIKEKKTEKAIKEENVEQTVIEKVDEIIEKIKLDEQLVKEKVDEQINEKKANIQSEEARCQTPTCPSEDKSSIVKIEKVETSASSLKLLSTENVICNKASKIAKEESDSFKENVKPVKVESKVEPNDSEVKKHLENNEVERPEISVIVRCSQDITEKSTEETEKLKNDQQAKIPLKKREIKMTDDFDSRSKGSFSKSVTPTKEMLGEEGKLDVGLKRTPVCSTSGLDGKQLLNGELSSGKIIPHRKTKTVIVNLCSTKENRSIPSNEENGIVGEKISTVIKSVVTAKTENNTNSMDTLYSSGKFNQKASLKSQSVSTIKQKALEVPSEKEAGYTKPKVDLIANNKPEDTTSKVQKYFLTKVKESVEKPDNSETPLPCGEPPEKPLLCSEPPEKPLLCSEPLKKPLLCDEPPEKPWSCVEPPEKPLSCGDLPEKPLSCGDLPEKPLSCGDLPEKPLSCSDPPEKPLSCGELPEKPSTCSEPSQLVGTQKKVLRSRSKRRPNLLKTEPLTPSTPPVLSEIMVVNDSSESKHPSKTKQTEKTSTDKEKLEPRGTTMETGKLDSVLAPDQEMASNTEKKTPVPKSKTKHRLPSEEENSGTESKEMTSERQKDGLKLTIRIANRKKKPEITPKSEDLQTKEADNDIKALQNSGNLKTKEENANLRRSVDLKTKDVQSLPKVVDLNINEDSKGVKSLKRSEDLKTKKIKSIPKSEDLKTRVGAKNVKSVPKSVELIIAEEEEESTGRSLRRSPRISRPSVKVTEVGEHTPDKKQSDEEEKPTAQQPDETGVETKAAKEPITKLKKPKSRRRRARWTVTRPRRNRKCSSVEESEASESECNSEKNSKGGEDVEKESSGPGEDDEPCKKCSLPNHPELILLCDSCDSGYHTACLRPPLMIIPDGEWYCPPCQHKLLCEKLEEQLQNLDVVIKKKERAERRKERLVYVGISLENIIPTQQEAEIPELPEVKKKDPKKSKPLERRSTRTRKCISYRFDEFDEAIDEAIEDDIRDSEGGGGGGIGKDMANITGHRGKDISTILEEERKESKRPQRTAAARRKKRRRLNDLDSDSNLDEDESEDEFKISDGSQDEFIVSEENPESDEDLQSNDSDGEIGARKPRRHYARPMRKSRRLRRRTVKRNHSDDDEEEETDDAQEESESNYSEYSDDYLEMRRRRSRRNAERQVNYKEDSESDASKKSVHYGRGKEMRRVRKRRHTSSESNGSVRSKDSENEVPRKRKKHSLRKPIRSSDDEPSENEKEKPIRKRLNRIETDEDDVDEEENSAKQCNDGDKETSAATEKITIPTSHNEGTKKPSYRLESDDDDFDNVKVESPLDYSLVDLPSTNGQSPGKTIENLIGKPSDKSQAPKGSTANTSLAPNGTGNGQDVIAPEEDEDELLRVTDLVDYVCNSEQL